MLKTTGWRLTVRAYPQPERARMSKAS